MSETYTAVYARDGDEWVAEIAGTGLTTRGNNVGELRNQIRDALAKQLTTRSLPEIGKKFGGRDHTTVMHAVRKIEELSLADAALAEDVELLRRMLQS